MEEEMPFQAEIHTCSRDITEKPGNGLGKGIFASIYKTVKPFLSWEHGWSCKVKLNNWAGQ